MKERVGTRIRTRIRVSMVAMTRIRTGITVKDQKQNQSHDQPGLVL